MYPQDGFSLMSILPQHLLVLLLENRSFDHMLGFLDHPDDSFTGLTGEEKNYLDPTKEATRVSSTADYTLAPDPGHSHASVMYQLTDKTRPRPPYKVKNSGFLRDFERMAREKGHGEGRGSDIMRCQDPSMIPVLSTLAREFAVLDHWFCSVPGETWPNRNFAVAATSNGEVNIDIRFYHDPTIFEQLEEYDRTWAIYHDGIAQVMAFPRLWSRNRRKNFKSIERLLLDIAENRLPNFAFIEPDHFGNDSTSQHPSNNQESGGDFLRAERLICKIYEELVKNQAVWERAAFLITYDEHGGLYDHVPPPDDERFRLRKQFRDDQYRFSFDLLGPRVPAVLISPFITQGTVDHQVYEHSSVIRTAQAMFIPDAPPLSDDSRDAVAQTFHHNLRLDAPRSPDLVPRFDCDVTELPQAVELESKAVETLDAFQQSLVALGKSVEQRIVQEERARVLREAAEPRPRTVAPIAERLKSVADADRYQDHVVGLFRSTAF